MSKAFNLTAQINLQGPTNLKPVIAGIRRELSTIGAVDLKFKFDPKADKSIQGISSKLQAMNAVLIQAKNNTNDLNNALKNLGNSLSVVSSAGQATSKGVGATASSAQAAAKSIKQAGTEMQEFGKQAALAVRRFAAFSIVSSTIYSLINAINSGFQAFVKFDQEIVKLQQITGKGVVGISALENEITKLATSLGVSSESLADVASILAQAGLTAEQTRVALAALARTELAPSFDSMKETAEGAIAAMRQFGIEAGQLESALGSINSVAAAFAVESADIITAIQRTGGVFASASKGVSEGTEALNEFISIFTSVRQTTRESAETIATGLRTIFTRIQRGGTINQLREFGVELTDLEGKFVGPYEAIKRLSAVLGTLDTRDLRFSQIVEELGGFRQISKVIPLIQQFTVAQDALKIAQQGQGSLTEAQVIAQKSLANQLGKVREQFLALIRDVGKSNTFKGLFKLVVGLTSGLISLAGAFKPILPILAMMGAIKGVSAIGQFATGFFGALKKGGGAGGAGKTAGGAITGSRDKDTSDATNRASTAIMENTSAIKTLTNAMNSLTQAVNNKTSAPGATFNSGGKVMAFARGGVVPGSGNRDTVPAMLQPGEFVLRKKAVETLGTGSLHKMNKYSGGGIAKSLPMPGAARYAAGGKIKDLAKNNRYGKASLKTQYDIADDFDTYSPPDISRQNLSKTYEKYTNESKNIWIEANKKYSQDIQNGYKPQKGDPPKLANQYIKEQTGGLSQSLGFKELREPMSLRKLNKIRGALAEADVKNQYPGLDILTAKEGADFYDSKKKTFIEVKNQKAALKDDTLISKALLAFASKTGNKLNNQPDNIPSLKILAITAPREDQYSKKNAGGMIQKFAVGGAVKRNVGILDYDMINDPSNASIVADGMKEFGTDGPRLYTEYLTNLAVKARKNKTLQKLRAVYGVAGSGKSSLAMGRGATDTATLRETSRFPILTPEDIDKASEVLVLSSVVSKDKLGEMFASTDRTYALSSTTQAEKDRVLKQRTFRDVSGQGLFGRKPGSTTNTTTDTAKEEALLMDSLGSRASILGRSGSGRLRRKSGNELVQISKKKLGFTWGGFSPTTAGHESIIDAASAAGISPEDFIALVGSNEAIQGKDKSSYRTAIFDQDFRLLLAKAGFGARGASVLPKAFGDMSVPLAFDMGESNGRRQITLPSAGSTAFVADKSEKELEKYTKAGYKAVNLPRTGGISGTQVRDLLLNGDLEGLSKVVSPGVFSLLQSNISQLQNRSNVLPSLIVQAQAAYDQEASIIDQQLDSIGIKRADNKRAAIDPEYAAQLESYQILKERKRKLQSRLSFAPYKLLDQLAKADPEKYGLTADTTRSVAMSPQTEAISTLQQAILEKVTKQTTGPKGSGAMPTTNDEILRMLGDETLPSDATFGEFAGKRIRDTKSKKGGRLPYWANGYANTNSPQKIEQLTATREYVKALYQKRMGNRTSSALAETSQAIDQSTLLGIIGLKGNNRLEGPLTWNLGKNAQGEDVNMVATIMERILPQKYSAVADYITEQTGNIVSTAATMLGGTSLKQLDSKKREVLNQGNIEGGILEQLLATLGANVFDDAVRTRAIDFPNGIGEMAGKIFGIDPDIPTEAKRTIDSGSRAKAIEEFQRYFREIYGIPEPSMEEVAQKFAGGGKISRRFTFVKGVGPSPFDVPKPKVDYYSLEKNSGFNAREFEQLAYTAKTHGYSLEEFQQFLAKRTKQKQANANLTSNPSALLKAITPEPPVASQKQIDLARSLMGPPDAQYNPKYDNARSKFASGGPVELFHGSNSGVNDSILESFKTEGIKSDMSKGFGQGSGFYVYNDKKSAQVQALNRTNPNKMMATAGDTSGKPMVVTLEEILDPATWDLDYELNNNKVIQWLYNNYDSLKNKLIPDDKGLAGIKDKYVKGEGNPNAPYMSAGLKMSDGYGNDQDIFSQTGGDIYQARMIGRVMSRLQADDPKTVHDFETEFFANMPPRGSALKYVGSSPLKPKNIETFAEGGEAGTQQKPTKNYGKIGLKNSGSEIIATYLGKKDRSGMVSAKKMTDNLYTIGLSKATKGYGPKLYDVVMEAATANGGMLAPDRNMISAAAQDVWSYYFNKRSDVRKTPLDKSQWTQNSALVDPKLLGDKKTWPPYSDPAWTLQSGYSKSLELLNSADIVNLNDEKYKAFLQSQQLSFFARGGSVQDTVPALLTPGEFVVNKKAAQSIGYGKLHKLNKADKIRGYNKGGIVNGVQKFEDGGPVIDKNLGDLINQEFLYLSTELDPFIDAIISGTATFDKVISGLDELAAGTGDAASEAQRLRDMLQTSRDFVTGATNSVPTTNTVGGSIDREAVYKESRKKAYDSAVSGTSEVGKNKLATIKSEVEGKYQEEYAAASGNTDQQKDIRSRAEQEYRARSRKEVLFNEQYQPINSTEGAAERLNKVAKTKDIRDSRVTDLTDQKDSLVKKKDETTNPIEAGLIQDEIDQLEKTIVQVNKDFEEFSSVSKSIQDEYVDGFDKLTQIIADSAKQEADAKAKIDAITKEAIDSAKQSSGDNWASMSADDQAAAVKNQLRTRQATEQQAAKNTVKDKLDNGEIAGFEGKKWTDLNKEEKSSLVNSEMASTDGTMENAAAERAKAATEKASRETEKTSRYGDAQTVDDVRASVGALSDDGKSQKKKMEVNEAALLDYKARKAGMGTKQYERSLVGKVADVSNELSRDYQGKKEEFKGNLAGKKEQFQSLAANTDTEFGKSQYNDAVSELAKELIAINPNQTFDEARKAAEEMAKSLSDSSQDASDALEAVGSALPDTMTEDDALKAAKARVAKEEGFDPGALEKVLSRNQKELGREQFIRSREGERFGRFAQFAPDLAKGISSSKLGGKLATGADFISGKGGRLSQAFAGAGGITGVGSGIAVAADQLLKRLPTSITQNPNAAGTIGAIGGAGGGAASGALLGGQLAGPIGAMIGGISGAIIGGLNGAFKAFNDAKLANNLKQLETTSGDLEIALKKLSITSDESSVNQVKKAAADDYSALLEIGQQANLGASGSSRNMVEWGRALDPTGLISNITGEPQEKEARDAIYKGIERQLGTYSKLGERNLARSPSEQIRSVMGVANARQKEIDQLDTNDPRRKELETERTTDLARSNQTYQMMRRSGVSEQDVFMQMGINQRKQRGQDVEKDLASDEGKAKLAEEGKKLAAIEAEGANRQQLLSNAMKETNAEADNLIDIFRRVNANLQRFGEEINEIKNRTNSTASAMSGKASIRNVDRTSERMLGNISAYSTAEIGAVADYTGQLAGGGDSGKQLSDQIKSAKVLQDELPRILKGTTGQNIDGKDGVIDQLKGVFAGLKLTPPPELFNEVEKSLQEKVAGRESASLSDLAGEVDVLGIASKVSAEAIKVATEFHKQYNDAIQAATDLTNDYAGAIQEAMEWSLKATQIRSDADIKLAETLGKNLSLKQLSKPFDQRIEGLSSGVISGGSTDPNKIYKAMQDALTQRSNMETQLKQDKDSFGANPSDDQKTALASQLAAMGEQDVAINNARKSLEELANDSSAASNALNKLAEMQKLASGSVNFLQKALTSDSKELMSMRGNLQAYTKLVSGKATTRDVNDLTFRQNAFAGFNEMSSMMPESMQKQMQAKMTRAMIEAMPNGKDFLSKSTGLLDPEGNPVSYDSALTMMEGGIDPAQQQYIDAYKDATARQADAADRLGMASMAVADEFRQGMVTILTAIQAEIPAMMTRAVEAGKAITPPPSPDAPKDAQMVQTEAELDAATSKPGLVANNTAANDRAALGTYAATAGIGVTAAAVGTYGVRRVLSKRKNGVESTDGDDAAPKKKSAVQEYEDKYGPMSDEDKKKLAAADAEAADAKKTPKKKSGWSWFGGGEGTPETSAKASKAASTKPTKSATSDMPKGKMTTGKLVLGLIAAGGATLGASTLFGGSNTEESVSDKSTDTNLADMLETDSDSVNLLAKIELNTRNTGEAIVDTTVAAESQQPPAPKTIEDALSYEFGTTEGAISSLQSVGADAIGLNAVRKQLAEPSSAEAEGTTKTKPQTSIEPTTGQKFMQKGAMTLNAGAQLAGAAMSFSNYQRTGDTTELLGTGAGILNAGAMGNRYVGAAGDAMSAARNGGRIFSGKSVQEGTVVQDTVSLGSDLLQTGVQLAPDAAKAFAQNAGIISQSSSSATTAASSTDDVVKAATTALTAGGDDVAKVGMMGMLKTAAPLLGKIMAPIEMLLGGYRGLTSTSDQANSNKENFGQLGGSAYNATMGILTGSAETGKSITGSLLGLEQGTELNNVLSLVEAGGRGATMGAAYGGAPGALVGGAIGMGAETVKMGGEAVKEGVRLNAATVAAQEAGRNNLALDTQQRTSGSLVGLGGVNAGKFNLSGQEALQAAYEAQNKAKLADGTMDPKEFDRIVAQQRESRRNEYDATNNSSFEHFMGYQSKVEDQKFDRSPEYNKAVDALFEKLVEQSSVLKTEQEKTTVPTKQIQAEPQKVAAVEKKLEQQEKLISGSPIPAPPAPGETKKLLETDKKVIATDKTETETVKAEEATKIPEADKTLSDATSILLNISNILNQIFNVLNQSSNIAQSKPIIAAGSAPIVSSGSKPTQNNNIPASVVRTPTTTTPAASGATNYASVEAEYQVMSEKLKGGSSTSASSTAMPMQGLTLKEQKRRIVKTREKAKLERQVKLARRARIASTQDNGSTFLEDKMAELRKTDADLKDLSRKEQIRKEEYDNAQTQKATKPAVGIVDTTQKDETLSADREAFQAEKKLQSDKTQSAWEASRAANVEASDAERNYNEAQQYTDEEEARGLNFGYIIKDGETAEQAKAESDRLMKEREIRIAEADKRKQEADKKAAEAQANYTTAEQSETDWKTQNQGRESELEQRQKADHAKYKLDRDRQIVATGQIPLAEKIGDEYNDSIYGAVSRHTQSDNMIKHHKLSKKVKAGQILTPEEQKEYDDFENKKKTWEDNRRAQAQANVNANGGMPSSARPGVNPTSPSVPQTQPVPSSLPDVRPRGSLDGGSSGDMATISGNSQNVISVDPSAQALLDGFTAVFGNFNQYIDKLATVAATIPSQIQLTGSYDLNVNITGAAAFEGLSKEMQSVAEAVIRPKLEQLRDEVSKATGGTVKSSASMGQRGDMNTGSAARP